MNGGNDRPEKRQKREIDTNSSCCIRIHQEPAPPSSSKVGATSSDDGDRAAASLLQDLIAPLDADMFLDKHFRNTAVHIKNPAPNTFKSIRKELYNLNPREILDNTSSEAIFVWLQMPAAAGGKHKKRMIQSIEVSDPDTALALYTAGHATYCRAPPRLEQYLVSSLLKDTGLGCGQYDPTGESLTCLGRGEVEVFISTPGHTTEWHYDFQENFTLQLSGKKKWSLQKSTVQHPLRGCTPHYQSPEAVEPQLKAAHLADPQFAFGEKPVVGTNAVGSVETVVLEPGDVLYHPAGIWHKVEALQEKGTGVSINISLMATNFAAITCQSLQHFLLKRNEWRQCLMGSGGGSSSSGKSVLDTLKSLMKELPSIVAEFERTVGADGILPPALCTPTGTASGGSNITSSWSPTLGDGADDNDDDDVDDGGNKADGVTGNALDVDGEEDEEEEEDFIDADAFELPIGCGQRINYEGAVALATNPLATLVDETDIQSFYYKSNRVDDDDDAVREGSNGKMPRVRVLNVNYAGIESQESWLRVRLRSSKWEQLQTYLDQRQPGNVPEGIQSLVSCLFYYGYLRLDGMVLK